MSPLVLEMPDKPLEPTFHQHNHPMVVTTASTSPGSASFASNVFTS
ncbi:hypothetical protein [Legionella tunisiensis]|nr:hypothetical protein [Legionella tunisiensis]